MLFLNDPKALFTLGLLTVQHFCEYNEDDKELRENIHSWFFFFFFFFKFIIYFCLTDIY